VEEDEEDGEEEEEDWSPDAHRHHVGYNYTQTSCRL
jgi:hypothetical protein